MAKREQWTSRTAFFLAATGSAIGLGNIWRFPYICFKYGGGAFLIPYLVALFSAGIPLMILEFSLGHKYQLSAPLAFAKVHKKLEWLGWFALLVAFGIVAYYTVIMGWCFNYMFHSIKLSWGENTGGFFYEKFLALSKNVFTIGSIRPLIFAGLIATWIWIVLSVWKGAKTIGKVVYVTVTLPWLCLLIFVIRGLTLPGAIDGLSYYLTPNFAALKDPKVWLAAYSQVFFSLSIGFGVMIAYASFLPKKSDIVNNAFLVSLANAGTSFAGGLAVFSTLGYYAHTTGLSVPDVVKSGPSLAFITYPTIISLLPFACSFFGILFFLMLLTLGVDSAFSLVEAGTAGIIDKWKKKRIPINFAFGIAAVIAGLIFTTKAGLYWLDIVDYFMSNFGLVIVALLECIFLGYLYREKGVVALREHANSVSEIKVGKWWEICIKVVTPIALIILLVLTVIERIKGAYENYPRLAEFLGGWLILIAFFVVAIILNRVRSKEG